MIEGQRLFIVNVWGVYGGEWFCAVYAESDKAAWDKARAKYPITADNWKEYEGKGFETETAWVAAEFQFDDNGVSNLWGYAW